MGSVSGFGTSTGFGFALITGLAFKTELGLFRLALIFGVSLEK